MDHEVEKFMHACDTEDIETMNNLFAAVHDKIDMGLEIAKATKNGNLSIVKCLHQHGVNLNGDIKIPFIIAASKGHMDVIDYLLKNKVDYHFQKKR